MMTLKIKPKTPILKICILLNEMESLWCTANNFSDLTDYNDDRVRQKKLFAAQ